MNASLSAVVRKDIGHEKAEQIEDKSIGIENSGDESLVLLQPIQLLSVILKSESLMLRMVEAVNRVE